MPFPPLQNDLAGPSGPSKKAEPLRCGLYNLVQQRYSRGKWEDYDGVDPEPEETFDPTLAFMVYLRRAENPGSTHLRIKTCVGLVSASLRNVLSLCLGHIVRIWDKKSVVHRFFTKVE